MYRRRRFLLFTKKKIVAAHTVVERLNELLFLESVSVSGLENLGFKKIKF